MNYRFIRSSVCTSVMVTCTLEDKTSFDPSVTYHMTQPSVTAIRSTDLEEETEVEGVAVVGVG